jgi:hypothetical protein
VTREERIEKMMAELFDYRDGLLRQLADPAQREWHSIARGSLQEHDELIRSFLDGELDLEHLEANKARRVQH